MLWCYIRHLAHDRHTVTRKVLAAFVASHRLWSISRLRGILKDGEYRFWFLRTGRFSGQQIVSPISLDKLVRLLTRARYGPSSYRVAYLPVDGLRGVDSRRGAMYEALVGASETDKAAPCSRKTHEGKTWVPISTQRRWNRLAGTRHERAALVVKEVSDDCRIDPKYVDGSHRIVRRDSGERVLIRQIGNITHSRYSSKRSVRLRHAKRQALSFYGESESCFAAHCTLIRYAFSIQQRSTIQNRRLSPRMRSGIGRRDRETFVLFEGDR